MLKNITRIISFIIISVFYLPCFAHGDLTDLSVPPRIIPFEDLGYSMDVSLYGVAPEFSVYIPNYKEVENVKAEIALRFSGVLNKKSTITVFIDDTPLFTKSIEQTGFEPVLSFGIKRSKSDYIKITFRGYLFITGDVCSDVLTGNLWMVVSKSSKIIIKSKSGKTPDRISSFFKNYESNLNIAFTSKKTDTDMEVLPLFYYIDKLNKWKKINFFISDSAACNMRNILVGDYSKDLEMKDGNLFITTKGIPLLKKSLMNLYITSSMNRSRVKIDEDRKRQEISFSDIDINNFTATGIGDLSFNIPIRYSFFSGIPGNLNLKLMVYHTPVPEDHLAFLKVFLNGVLIKAFQLKKEGNTNSYEVKVPEELFKGWNNNLNIVASYSIGKGDCKGSIPRMTISILDSSRFYFDHIARKKIISVMDVMGSMSGRVLVMIDDRNMLNAGIYLMDILGKYNSEISVIDVVKWDGKIGKGYDFVILLLNPSSTQELNAPLKLDQGSFSIINPQTQKELFYSEPGERTREDDPACLQCEEGFGVFQIFDEEDSKILMLSYYKDIKALEFLKNFEMENIMKMNGNVVIFDQEIGSFEAGDKLRAVYKDIKTIGYYWEKFKLFIVLAIGLIIVIFIYFINKKLVRE